MSDIFENSGFFFGRPECFTRYSFLPFSPGIVWCLRTFSRTWFWCSKTRVETWFSYYLNLIHARFKRLQMMHLNPPRISCRELYTQKDKCACTDSCPSRPTVLRKMNHRFRVSRLIFTHELWLAYTQLLYTSRI